MESVFISRLKPLLDAVAQQMELYVPKKSGGHYVYTRYDPSAGLAIDFNNIRVCTPVKEFLFPLRELAAVYPETSEPEQIKPFAVFGLKDCDLRSIEILDKVFNPVPSTVGGEVDFRDQSYVDRRNSMFIISGDCSEPGESCFCNIFDSKGFADRGFDLNVSQIKTGFIIEAGSQKGKEFIDKHLQPPTGSGVDEALLAERDINRSDTQKQLEANNRDLKFDASPTGSGIKQVVEQSQDSDVFDIEAQNCVECQACTRVCPTCHCFYLYDTTRKEYFGKMKMWDSCMRMAYAQVAGGANPRKVLGERIKHRLMHKFAYFLDRYGIDMCVGCGRCVDADAGGMDIRQVLKKLNDEQKKAKVSKVS